MNRHSTAVWQGSGKDGHGDITTQSCVLNKTQFSYKSRFEEGVGTNPDELVAAAHAGCFTMKLSFVLQAAGFTPDVISTQCTVTLADGAITGSHLKMSATVPGIDESKFNECAEEAKANCIISNVLNTSITLEATLN